MAWQILPQFDPGKKFAVLRQKMGQCAAALIAQFHENGDFFPDL